MRLGGSLARRRRQAGRRRSAPAEGARTQPAWVRGRAFPALVAGLTALFWAAGYFLFTRVVFPAPPPPGDLFEVPDVRGLALTDARDLLTGAGLAMGEVDSLQHPSVPPTVVLGQSPVPGQLSAPGGSVRVTMSLGPQLQSVPDVVGLEEDRARVVLETTGFVVSVDTLHTDVPAGHVAEMFPSADSVVPLPAEVRLRVSLGPPMVPMPLVLGLSRDQAVKQLTSLGLVVEEVQEIFRFGRDRGIVVEQYPAADTLLAPGTPVRLSVGRDPGRRRDGGREQ